MALRPRWSASQILRVMVCSKAVGEGEGVEVVLVRVFGGEHGLVGSDKVEAMWLDLNEECAGTGPEEESGRPDDAQSRPVGYAEEGTGSECLREPRGHGHGLERMDSDGRTIENVARVAGVAAHDLRVMVECEKAKLDVDFYQKTFHSHDYFTAPRPGEKDALGPHDNSWCSDPQAVIDFMATVKKPWIAFKILAAGAIAPRAGFTYAVNSGADFILVGMFDWQVAEDAALARRVVRIISKPGSKRTRPWDGRVAVG